MWSWLRGPAVAVAAVGLLVGCGSGPSQVGAAAIVGDTAVSLEQVQERLSTVLVKEGPEAKAQLVAGAQLDEVARQIVTNEVRGLLLDEAAEREGLTVDEAEITALVDQLGGAEAASAGTIFAASGFRAGARDQLLAVALGREALLNLAVTLDFTTVDTREAAMARVAELAAAGSAGARELIQADAARGAAAGLDQRIVGLDNPDFAAAPVFGVDPGTVVAFPSGQEGGSWLVTVVTEVGGAPPANPAQLAAVEPTVLEAVGMRQLAPIADDLGVRVSPRYGVWDPVSGQVVAGESDLMGFIAPLRERSPV